MPSKSVLITGCSEGGIGSALALSYHAKGNQVFATARSLSKIQHLRDLGLSILALDVTDITSIQACVEQVANATGGKLDILVNNAGIECSMPLLDVDMQDARKTFDANFFGVLSMVQAFAPLLIKAKGRIVNISSVAQFTPVPWLGVYNCTKAALAMLSDNLRLEMAPFGVKVICVITGGVVSNIHNNQLTNPLPPDSVYSPARKEIENILAGSISKKFMSPVDGVAGKIVRNSLSRWPSTSLCAGASSTTIWAMHAFAWHTVWDWLLPFSYGIWTLEKNLKTSKDG